MGWLGKALRGVLISLGLIVAVCIYVAVQCARPSGQRPVFGDFRAHYTWDHGITAVRIERIGTPRELTDPISRILIPRMIRAAADKKVISQFTALGVDHGDADTDVRIYGDVFPCSARPVLRVYVRNLDEKRGTIHIDP